MLDYQHTLNSTGRNATSSNPKSPTKPIRESYLINQCPAQCEAFNDEQLIDVPMINEPGFEGLKSFINSMPRDAAYFTDSRCVRKEDREWTLACATTDNLDWESFDNIHVCLGNCAEDEVCVDTLEDEVYTARCQPDRSDSLRKR